MIEARRAMSDHSRVGTKGRRSAWDNRTSIRRLHGIEYRMLEDSDDIHDFINTEVREELEEDLEGMGEDPRHITLLNTLPKRKWKLEIVGVADVRLNPLILDSTDLKTGRKFVERLEERRSELRKALETGGTVIWPIVLVREEQLLVDGYCRHSTLREMNIPEAYGYVGHLVNR
jgi:hypothetical protein